MTTSTVTTSEVNDAEVDLVEEEELMERRHAELEFITAAYGTHEAWFTIIINNNNKNNNNCGGGDSNSCGHSDDPLYSSRRSSSSKSSSMTIPNCKGSNNEVVRVYRRLVVDMNTTTFITGNLCFVLVLCLPPSYPIHDTIEVTGYVEEMKEDRKQPQQQHQQQHYSGNTKNCQKEYYDRKQRMEISFKELLHQCQTIANEMMGEESVFSIFTQAEEWLLLTISLNDEWVVTTNVNHEQHEHLQPPDLVDPSVPPTMIVVHNTSSTCVVANSTQVQVQHQQQQQQQIQILRLCRKLIYSHHIISQQKRKEMLLLGKEYQLSGYMKIGWPGIIIIEGLEDNCQQFYDTIRKWSWQYLVLRGETTSEEINVLMVGPTTSTLSTQLDPYRLFPSFHEVDDMSIVASHCRSVGLSDLFMTSMKIYNNSNTNNNNTNDTKTNNNQNSRKNNNNNRGDTHSHMKNNNNIQQPLLLYYGALIHVDHMNNGKSYRKWLRKVCYEHNVHLLLKQCYPQQQNNTCEDYSTTTSTKKPFILVGLVGTITTTTTTTTNQHDIASPKCVTTTTTTTTTNSSISNSNSNSSNNNCESTSTVAAVMKRWRTTKVDIDSKGKPCYERMMSILYEGQIISASVPVVPPEGVVNDNDEYNNNNNNKDDWNTESKINTTIEKIIPILDSIGGSSWSQAVQRLLQKKMKKQTCSTT